MYLLPKIFVHWHLFVFFMSLKIVNIVYSQTFTICQSVLIHSNSNSVHVILFILFNLNLEAFRDTTEIQWFASKELRKNQKQPLCTWNVASSHVHTGFDHNKQFLQTSSNASKTVECGSGRMNQRVNGQNSLAKFVISCLSHYSTDRKSQHLVKPDQPGSTVVRLKNSDEMRERKTRHWCCGCCLLIRPQWAGKQVQHEALFSHQ